MVLHNFHGFHNCSIHYNKLDRSTFSCNPVLQLRKKKNTNISIMNTNSINLGNDNTSTFHPKTNQFVPKPADACRYCGTLAANDTLFWKSKNNGCNQHQHHRYLICSDCIQAADWHFQHFSDQGPKSYAFKTSNGTLLQLGLRQNPLPDPLLSPMNGGSANWCMQCLESPTPTRDHQQLENELNLRLKTSLINSYTKRIEHGFNNSAINNTNYFQQYVHNATSNNHQYQHRVHYQQQQHHEEEIPMLLPQEIATVYTTVPGATVYNAKSPAFIPQATTYNTSVDSDAEAQAKIVISRTKKKKKTPSNVKNVLKNHNGNNHRIQNKMNNAINARRGGNYNSPIKKFDDQRKNKKKKHQKKLQREQQEQEIQEKIDSCSLQIKKSELKQKSIEKHLSTLKKKCDIASVELKRLEKNKKSIEKIQKEKEKIMVVGSKKHIQLKKQHLKECQQNANEVIQVCKINTSNIFELKEEVERKLVDYKADHAEFQVQKTFLTKELATLMNVKKNKTKKTSRKKRNEKKKLSKKIDKQ